MQLTQLCLFPLNAQCPAGTYVFTPCSGNDDNVCQGVCVCVCVRGLEVASFSNRARTTRYGYDPREEGKTTTTLDY